MMVELSIRRLSEMHNMRLLLGLSFLILATTTAWGGGPDTYEKAVFEDGNQKLNYRMLRPAKIEAGKKYPLVLFLHGAGERGDNNAAQLTHGGSLFSSPQNREKYPAFVIFPQCPSDKRWVEVDWSDKTPHASPKEPSDPMRLTKKLLDQLMKTEPVDADRIYVLGLSMGGFGTWDVLQRYPDVAAAAVPICGGADNGAAEKMKHVAIWAFHGGADNTVWPQRSRSIVEELKKANGNVRYSEYDKVGHNSWSRAFAEPELLPWLFAQKRGK
jgi:predicted peptidase